VGGFGESIHDHPNRVKIAGSQRLAHNEVYAYAIPLPMLSDCNSPPGFI
jgi:hypothetical protein